MCEPNALTIGACPRCQTPRITPGISYFAITPRTAALTFAARCGGATALAGAAKTTTASIASATDAQTQTREDDLMFHP